VRCIVAALVVAAVVGVSPASASTVPPIHHVWLVELENKSYSQSLTGASDYLGKTIPSLGQVLTQSYATGHASLDNYVAQVSGQSANALTQADCPRYMDVLPGVVGPGGQAVGEGCVYPTAVQTIGDQMSGAHLTWKGYMEDMGNSPSRDNTNAQGACGHPALNSTDGTETASATDQYATRHNPFMYFHSIIDSAKCNNVVSLKPLANDLTQLATTPNFSWITPNLCNDGHDTGCTGVDVAGKNDGGIISTNRWLSKYIPMILQSAAFRADGMLIITWDESDTSDTSSCCGEAPGPGSPLPGITGSGGGHVATIVISRFVKPGTTNPTPYNHFSVLRSIEDVFGLSHLAAAGASGLQAFGSDVYAAALTAPAPAPPPSTPAAAPTPGSSGTLPVTGGEQGWAALAAGLLLFVVVGRAAIRSARARTGPR
jgi:hypothetical protein